MASPPPIPPGGPGGDGASARITKGILALLDEANMQLTPADIKTLVATVLSHKLFAK